MIEKKYFDYGEIEINYLKSKDPILADVIDQIGHIYREVTPDLFEALVNSIVAQQIASKARDTIWKRMIDKINPFTPENIMSTPDEELQNCGMSFRKVSYIKEIANAVIDGSLDLNYLQTLSDDEVCERLVQIKGLGVWTAEMLMTFSMQRSNVMSYGDLAILRGLRMIYHHRKITPSLFNKYKRRFSPYATVASLYVWAVAGGDYPDYVDYAPMTDAQKRVKAIQRRKR